MSTIHLQLIQRAQTLHAGDTITLRFPLDATSPERDLTIGGDVAPLLTAAESDYYLPDPLRDPARLPLIGQTLYRWLDGDDRYLTRAIDAQRGKTKAVALLLEQEAGLDHLPWELLHDGTGYLVQQSPTAVIPVRWQPGNLPETPFYTSAQNRPLHVVLMATAPQGVLPVLDFEGEEARIMDATQRQPLRLSVEESGNLRELGYLLGDLGEGAVDVVHLTGHATHTSAGPRFLCEDEVGAAHLAAAQAIADGLTHTPRLLFLSGCRTGQALRRGEIASLAAALVVSGIPAVLGWGQTVFDPDATLAAATLYGALAQGQTLVRALAETYGTMLQQHAADPTVCRHWHLLRLYARGRQDGICPVTQPLVTAPRTAGRARLTITQREPDHLDDEQRVPVAKRADFVGRRRVLQACLAALRPDAEALGVILHGMGGHGKSTLAHRLRQRWLQRSAAHTALVLYGKLDEESLLRKLNNGLRSQPAREQLNGRDSLRFRLRAAMESCDEQLLIILDNFEDNFEQAGGAPSLIDGRPLLTGATVQLLEDLSFALQGSRERGQAHRLLITSRYRPTWRGVDAFFACQLDKLNDEAVQKKVTRLAPAGTAPVVADQTTLRQRAITIADGNPRLLEWLFDLLDQRGTTIPDLDAVLAQMAGAESALREDILAAALLAAQTPALRQLLARGLVCELPVPETVFAALAALDPALPNRTIEQERATTLGLLETTITNDPITNHLRVPRLLAPLLVNETQPDRATLAATAAQTLHTSWRAPDDADPSEAQLLEIHRLALAGGVTELAADVADTLAGRWNRADQYRYREVIDLVTRTVAQSANARLWNEIGYAQSQLGEQQEALRYFNLALPLYAQVGDKWGEAAILNNLGSVYDDLGEKQEALRYYNLALPLFEQVGDKWGEAAILNNLGSVYDDLGEKQEALRYYNLALPLFEQVGDKGGEATTLNNLGSVYDDLGEKQEALRYYNLALPLRRQVGDKGGEARTLGNIGKVHIALGQLQEALRCFNQILPLFGQVEDKTGKATTLNEIGRVYSALGEKQEALHYYNLALPLSQQVGDKGGEATTLNNLGGVYSALGEKQEALRYFNLALPLFEQVGDKGGEATTLNNLGSVYDDLGEKQEALRYYNLALPLRRQVGDKGGEATTLNNLGSVYDDLGEIEKSLEFMQQAATIYHKIGAAWEEVNSQWWLGVLYQKLGNRAAALNALDRGITLATALGHPNLPQLQALRNQLDPGGTDE